MVINILVLIALFGYNCSCDIPLTLDILNPLYCNDNVTHITEAISKYVYTSYINYSIIKIKEGNIDIWSGSKGQKCISCTVYKNIFGCILIHIETSIFTYHRYIFYKKDLSANKWDKITFNCYSTSLSVALHERIFDINSNINNISIKNVIINEQSNFIFLYAFIERFFIRSIVDHKLPIWSITTDGNKDRNLKCTSMNVYCIKKEPILIVLYIESTINKYKKYFCKKFKLNQIIYTSINTEEQTSTVGHATPHEVQSTSPSLADSSSNYLPVSGIATPGDRGSGDSGTGPQVEPAADLREAEGEVNRRADGRTTSGGLDTSCEGAVGGEDPLEGPSNRNTISVPCGYSDNIPIESDYHWVEIEKNEFTMRMNKTREPILELDISDDIRLLRGFSIRSHHPYGAKSIIYTANAEINVNLVKDGDVQIWETKDVMVKCVDAIIFFDKSNKIKLLQLFIADNITSTSFRYYIKLEDDGKMWVEISHNEYHKQLNILDKS